MALTALHRDYTGRQTFTSLTVITTRNLIFYTSNDVSIVAEVSNSVYLSRQCFKNVSTLDISFQIVLHYVRHRTTKSGFNTIPFEMKSVPKHKEKVQMFVSEVVL